MWLESYKCYLFSYLLQGYLWKLRQLTLILPRSRTGTVCFYTSTSNKRAARPKLHTNSLTRDLKLMYSRFTLVRISININSSQLNMFREIILPIFRSTGLCVTACGVMHPPWCCRPSAGNIVGAYTVVYCHMWSVRLCHIFLQYFIKGPMFGKRVCWM